MEESQKEKNLSNYIMLFGATIILIIVTYYIFFVASIYFSAR